MVNLDKLANVEHLDNKVKPDQEANLVKPDNEDLLDPQVSTVFLRLSGINNHIL